MKNIDEAETHAASTGFSRRDFMKLGGLAAAIPVVAGPTVLHAAGEEIPVYGPGKAPVTLKVNGKKHQLELEPRVTLLDALRDNLDLTGSKRVCDRGACGACTVLLDGRPVYACSILAIDAQDSEITTIEGLSQGPQLTPVQQAFVDNDAQQCGFCTPGFIVATTAFMKSHAKPTEQELRQGLSGNFCRCGTYKGIHGAIRQLAGEKGA